MTKMLMIAATLVSSSMFLFATDAVASAQQNQAEKQAAAFDCGSMSISQLTTLQNKSTAVGLKDLAKRCDDQAEMYELSASKAMKANGNADVSSLHEKAANAYMNVALFTNSSLLKAEVQN